MKRKFRVGILAALILVILIFALSSFVWLKKNTESSGVRAAEHTMNRLDDSICRTPAAFPFESGVTITDDGMFLVLQRQIEGYNQSSSKR